MAAAKNQPTSVDKLKNYESQISTVFGFIIVVVIGLGLLFLLRRSTMAPTPKISDLGGQTAENLMKDEQNTGKYVVKAGDNLWKIAQDQLKDGYQWPTVAKANGIAAPYVVTEGQELTIPSPDPEIKSPNAIASTTATTTPTASSEPTSSPQATSTPVATGTPTPTATAAPASQGSQTPANSTHTVAIGENLWKIAVAEYNDGYKWVEIYKANKDVIGANPGIIIAGQKLNLPDLK